MMVPIIVLILVCLFEQVMIHYYFKITYKKGLSIMSKQVVNEGVLNKIEKDGLRIEENSIYFFKKTIFQRINFFIIYGELQDRHNYKVYIKMPIAIFIMYVLVNVSLIAEYLGNIRLYSNLLLLLVLNLFVVREYIGIKRKYESLIKELFI